MPEPIYCSKCLQEIRVRSDLVTATNFWVVEAYHEACYASDLKSAKTLTLNNQPINGFSGTFTTMVAFIAFITIIAIYDEPIKWTASIFLIAVGYRLYSYFVYERHIEK